MQRSGDRLEGNGLTVAFVTSGMARRRPWGVCPLGDWIAYYSPRTQMKGGEAVQAFTAIGRVKPGEPYPFDMGNGFVPARRGVNFYSAHDAPVRPLVNRLSFIKNKSN